MNRPASLRGFTLIELSQTVRKGFTLIELLVVITIIVVLLALLTPAMDKAIYQAELAVCGTGQHAVATGAIVYAQANKRFYPWFNAVLYNYVQPSHLKIAGDDYRRTLRTFMPINKLLNDPLAPQAIDLDGSTAGEVVGSYARWFGYYYAGEKAMRRLGDRWTYAPAATPDDRSTYSAMLSDYMTSFQGTVYTSHPDHRGEMGPNVVDNASFQDPITLALTLGGTFSFSRWAKYAGAVQANPLSFDANTAYDDGSVRRLSGMTLDQQDKRLGQVALYQGKNNDTLGWYFLPYESR